jgi:hypothetical protein
MSKSDTLNHETDIPAFEPMSFGMILDRAIQLYVRNFSLLVGITVIPQVLTFLINLTLA